MGWTAARWRVRRSGPRLGRRAARGWNRVGVGDETIRHHQRRREHAADVVAQGGGGGTVFLEPHVGDGEPAGDRRVRGSTQHRRRPHDGAHHRLASALHGGVASYEQASQTPSAPGTARRAGRGAAGPCCRGRRRSARAKAVSAALPGGGAEGRAAYCAAPAAAAANAAEARHVMPRPVSASARPVAPKASAAARRERRAGPFNMQVPFGAVRIEPRRGRRVPGNQALIDADGDDAGISRRNLVARWPAGGSSTMTCIAAMAAAP